MPAHRAVAGSSLGNGDAGAVLWSQPLSQSSGTGLSQGVQQIALSGTGLSQQVNNLSVAPQNNVTQGLVNLDTAALTQFISGEIMQHVELVQAARGASDDATTVAIHFPVDWAHFRALLGKLAYDTDSADNWSTLDFLNR